MENKAYESRNFETLVTGVRAASCRVHTFAGQCSQARRLRPDPSHMLTNTARVLPFPEPLTS